MPMVIVGVLLLVAKLAELGPFGRLSWFFVLAPFALAVLWWEFADSSGWTQRQVMAKMEARKAERRQKAMEALGLDRRREKLATRSRRDAARLASADPTQAAPPGEPHSAPAVSPAPKAPPESRREPRL